MKHLTLDLVGFKARILLDRDFRLVAIFRLKTLPAFPARGVSYGGARSGLLEGSDFGAWRGA